MKSFLKNELSGWKKWDVIWLVIATVIILGVSLYFKEDAVGIFCALTGVWCVILTGKGKLSSYIFGTINVILYAYVAFGAKYYGEVMLNLIYYFPMNFVGFFAWKKHMNEENSEVLKKRMPLKKSLLIYAATAVAIFVYGLLLRHMGGKLPFVDSMSTVISVVAQILCIMRLAEQWVLWIVVDVITVIMWAFAFANGGESVATLLMWIVYLLNGIFMFVKWHKEAREENAV